MNKTQIWLIDPNNKTKQVIDCIVDEIPSFQSAGSAALKDAYNGLTHAVGILEMQLEMTPDQNFWIGWDLCREAYIEQFQKQNRALLTGTFIGAIK